MKSGKRPFNNAPATQKRLKKAGEFLAGFYRYILLITMGYVIIYPLIFMISTSLKTSAAFLDPSIVWIPRVFTADNFKKAIEALSLPDSFVSSVKYELVSAGIEIISCSVTAYGMARFDFKVKTVLNALLILLLFIPRQMLIIQMMMNFANLDLFGILGLIGKAAGTKLTLNTLNTVFPFYLPSLLAVGLRSGIIIFIYIQFFKGLPKELEEAAWIDGAGPLKTYIKIALPSSGVVILTVSVFSIIWHWNDYYLAVMYTSGNFPIAVKLNTIRDILPTMGINGITNIAPVIMAACVIFISPMLVMYMILQKKFIKSIDRVGITG